ncbi:MAG: hypothetical protein KAT70_02140 [Thermoplasmata archaeon]|nr:hypothetical protein [Thermoplasmata archaeon]
MVAYVEHMKSYVWRRNAPWHTLLSSGKMGAQALWPPLGVHLSIAEYHLKTTQKQIDRCTEEAVNGNIVKAKLYHECIVYLLDSVASTIGHIESALMMRSESQTMPPISYSSSSLVPFSGCMKVHMAADHIIKEFCKILDIDRIHVHPPSVVFGPHKNFRIDTQTRVLRIPINHLFRIRFLGSHLSHEAGHLRFAQDLRGIQFAYSISRKMKEGFKEELTEGDLYGGEAYWNESDEETLDIFQKQLKEEYRFMIPGMATLLPSKSKLSFDDNVVVDIRDAIMDYCLLIAEPDELRDPPKKLWDEVPKDYLKEKEKDRLEVVFDSISGEDLMIRGDGLCIRGLDAHQAIGYFISELLPGLDLPQFQNTLVFSRSKILITEALERIGNYFWSVEASKMARWVNEAFANAYSLSLIKEASWSTLNITENDSLRQNTTVLLPDLGKYEKVRLAMEISIAEFKLATVKGLKKKRRVKRPLSLMNHSLTAYSDMVIDRLKKEVKKRHPDYTTLDVAWGALGAMAPEDLRGVYLNVIKKWPERWKIAVDDYSLSQDAPLDQDILNLFEAERQRVNDWSEGFCHFLEIPPDVQTAYLYLLALEMIESTSPNKGLVKLKDDGEMEDQIRELSKAIMLEDIETLETKDTTLLLRAFWDHHLQLISSITDERNIGEEYKKMKMSTDIIVWALSKKEREECL